MLIGINMTAAFNSPRTGVEEYVYQLVKNMTMLKESREHRFSLYTPQNLKWPLPMWTQARLSLEMAFKKPDALFIPVHVLPLIHPRNSVATIHGLEFEYYPETYPWRHRNYLRWSSRYALKHAREIIAVSENTKNDLVKLYGGDPEKIKVIYHGISRPPAFEKVNFSSPFILFIGRLETRKNILGLIRAYQAIKKKYQIPHKLVLAGPPGYGYGQIKKEIQQAKPEIKEMGYVSRKVKWGLLKKADLFVMPSFYEGFGLPLLEAQQAGCPIVSSSASALPEVTGKGALLADPSNIEQMSELMYKVINSSQAKDDLIQKGYKNIKRFSWRKCARQTLKTLAERN